MGVCVEIFCMFDVTFLNPLDGKYRNETALFELEEQFIEFDGWYWFMNVVVNDVVDAVVWVSLDYSA